MKAYGHTGTLFIQGGKYKWSYKHDFCLQCKGVKFKHKGNGLCTSCTDKKRASKGKRISIRKIASSKFHFKKRIIHWLNTPEKKKTGIKGFLTEQDKKDYKKQWYIKHRQENSELYKLKAKVYRQKRSGKQMLQMNINGVLRYFPFPEIPEKPFVNGCNNPEYIQRKRINQEFDILSKYYRSKTN